MTIKDRPPRPEVIAYHDEHEAKGAGLFEAFMARKNSPELLLKAVEEFALSSNPEGPKMAILCKGVYFFKKGKEEKDHDKARRLFLKAITEFKKVDPKDVLIKQAELHFLKRKLLSDEQRKKKPDMNLWLRRANLFKELGEEKPYHHDMALYHMFYIMENLRKLEDGEIFKHNELMIEHAQKGEDGDTLLKTKSLYHQIKAQHVFSPKEKLEEFGKAIEAIKKTSDKYGEEMTETEYMMTKAMMTGDSKKRNELLKQVAERYHKSGQKKREDFVRKLMNPVPLRAAGIITVADQSLEKLRKLEQKINERKGSEQGPFTIFYHLSYMMERIKDVRRILVRMAITRKKITELNIRENALRPKRIIPGKPYPKRLNAVINKNHELREQIKQDMESLLIYGNLLLDQWSYLIGYIAGYQMPDKAKMQPSVYFRDFLHLFTNDDTLKELKEFWKNHKNETQESGIEMNFIGLLSLLQQKNYGGELSDFWSKHKRDIIWLNFHLRFFRNVFIEHLRKPWQRGDAMGTYGDDYNLFIPAAVGFIKPEEEKKILEEIYPLSPQRLRDMPDDYWEKKRLKRVLEVTLYYIDEIEEQADRDKVWNAWHKIGGSTPSYDVIGGRLFNYLFTSIDTIIEFIDKHSNLLKLGKFG